MNARRIARAAFAATLSVIAVAGAAGCSEIASLKQVSGNTTAAISFAATDVLLDQKIPILVAPVCTSTTDTTTCTGKTASGAAITVSAQNNTALQMQVQVGGKTVFSGSGQAILDQRAQGSS